MSTARAAKLRPSSHWCESPWPNNQNLSSKGFVSPGGIKLEIFLGKYYAMKPLDHNISYL